MPSNPRPSPHIPDHDVLRKIGGGAYGEVWLARGVTGALRAVKVVWRDDFEDERGFEREFEGILKFEPISRDHPALVNILHVGRGKEGEPFYYYVMELGDDVHTGRDINPVEYEPRTLRGDHHQGVSEQWPLEECLDVGLRLAEALQHLHENGLAHRDVKPSNIIFVNGKAKLADIGLVAARGQRTFVGTEGFVPPEGPGSAQADVYSLGKVLYEIATGLDRMNFPELPEEIPADGDRKRWLELNRIICEVCEPRISKRKISTAAALAESLRRLQRGKRRRQSGLSLALTSLLIAGFSCWVGWQFVKDTEWAKRLQAGPMEPKPIQAYLRVFSVPEDADVLDADGRVIGTTPTGKIPVRVGEEVSYVLRKPGYRKMVVGSLVNMAAVHEPMILYGEMQVFSPPVVGEPWMDQMDQAYQPDGDSHISYRWVSREVWTQGLKKSPALGKIPVEFFKTTENGELSEVVLASADGASKFCDWYRGHAIEAGYLTEEHEVKPVPEGGFMSPELSESALKNGLKPFRLKVRKIEYGQVYVTTHPAGAELFINGKSVGLAHGELIVPNVKPGPLKLLMVLEGYKPLAKDYVLKEGELLELHYTLVKNQGVVFGRPWENEMGMKFAPVGKDLMVSIWETRVKDYEVFVRDRRYPAPRPPGFKQTEDHPVVNVSRTDAEAFCAWLTKRERARERISQNHYYRLPTDMEWSLLVGLNDEDAAASPGYRDARKTETFPWGDSWAEGNQPGNYADMAAALSPGVQLDRSIPGYDDGFAFTAPVGSFHPNALGIYDLSGNVQEWVSDSYSNAPGNKLGVLRGAGWNSYRMEDLYSGTRNAVPPGYSDAMYGFRVVLAKESAKGE